MLCKTRLRRVLPKARAFAMASNANSSTAANRPPYPGKTLRDLPKSWRFTESLPTDSTFPTPADSFKTPREKIRPRQVRDALFTWVRPETQANPELLGVSRQALRDLGIQQGEETTEDFRQFVAGNKLYGWDDEKLEGGYPWAQCYGGFQFGQWAGQLGDGRAISLFETTNPATDVRYELQLKGAGMTPYSRFADGKAVLRSSIREFVVSEALNALRIPTTRALSLTLLPESKVLRERLEPGAIVLRFAQSWIRLGTFDLLRSRGDRKLLRELSTYVATDAFGGWDKLPGRLDNPDKPAQSGPVGRGVSETAIEGPDDAAENRFTRFYREVVRRNAITVANWQAYGFMNGVLNTDNTSIFGLSIDYGPFAFMDDFDPSYTPNHDDGMLRYSYKNQPTIIWWNLVRLGEGLGELMGMGAAVDDPTFVSEGAKENQEAELVARAEKLITQAGEEYKHTFLSEYKRLMTLRLGLRQHKESDFEELFSEALDTLQSLELDFHHFFRRLSSVKLASVSTEKGRKETASIFFHKEGPPKAATEDEARTRLANWLEKWHARVIEDWSQDGGSVTDGAEAERIQGMKEVNPNFVPRGWILDEIIERVEKRKERDVLDRVMQMALHPFEDSWNGNEFDGTTWKGDQKEEQRWVDDPPRFERALQCSCSS